MLQALKTRRTRERVIQAIVLVLTLGLLVTFILTTRHNLLAQGIATGFGFLERSTGWPINFSLIEISARSPYWRMLVAGLLNTLLVGFIGLALATVVGVAMGLARISSNFVLNMMGTTYVEVFRNVPLILQVFVWYAVLTHLPIPRNAISLAGFGFLSNRGLMLPGLDMTAADLLALCVAGAVLIYAALRIRKAEAAAARPVWSGVALGLLALVTVLLLTGRTPDSPLVTLPELRGLRFVGGIEIKPEFSALLIAITVFGGAYVGEIVRGGFLAVDKGKIEAARALGLSGFQINWLVRIPLAVRAALPALANQYIWLMKATTLGIAIGYPDYFMVVSTSINQSGQTIELLAMLMGGFLLVNYAISWVMNRINDRLAIKGKAG